jgi:hypothetical protein
MDKFPGRLSITVTPLPSANVSLGKVVNSTLSSFRQSLTDFKLIESRPTNLNNSQGQMLVYTYRDPKLGLLGKVDVGTITDNKLYIISYVAPPAKYYDYFPTIPGMIKSFQIMKTKSSSNMPLPHISESSGGAGENTTSSAKIIKVLLSDVIRSLQANDSKAALIHLNILKQQLVLSNTSSSIFGPAKVLVNDAIQNLQRADINTALIHLNLVVQQLDQTTVSPAIGTPAKATSANTTRPEAMPTFLTYEKPNLGFEIQYPSNWIVGQNKNYYVVYEYGHSEVVTFYAPADKNNSSRLGPYVTIRAFNLPSTVYSLKGYIDGFAIPGDIGVDNTLLSSNDNVTLAGYSAYQYVYSSVEQKHSLNTMVIATLKDGRLFEISYTSDIRTYGKSLPTAEKMIHSFQFTKIIPNNQRVGSSIGLTNQTAYSITHNNITSIHQHFNSTQGLGPSVANSTTPAQPVHSSRIHGNRTMFSGNSTLPNAISPSSHATPVPNNTSQGNDGG